MIISGNRLRLYYWLTTRTGSGYCNLPEIEKGQYGYDLQPGQTVCALRYDKSNALMVFDATVKEVNGKGILVSYRQRKQSGCYEDAEIFLPWKHNLLNANKLIPCNLYVEPCDWLFEKNRMADILSGKIPTETWIDEKLEKSDGEGIWYHWGGKRTPVSKYAGNLKNFVRIGQMELSDIT